MPGNILLIDDEESLRKLLSRILSLEGFTIEQAPSLRAGHELLERKPIDVILCDVRLPDGSGVDFVKTVKTQFPLVEIILLTAYGNIPDGVQAIKLGAFDYITKGNDNDRIVPLINVAQGQANNKVILLKNITSFKELDVAKTNFIATVSHELKTPLASSDFSLKLLADHRVGPLSSDQQELIEQLKKDNQRMLRILSELLNMAQVEAGKIILNIQQLEPARAVEDSIMAIRNMALEKQIQIVNESEPGLPTIPADADKINWVLNNFLTNAIRYSPAQSKIIIKATRTPGAISFSVADAGSGIEEAYQQRIFERYFQVPGRSDKKGSGIGLAICKEFIEAMDGKIWIHSRPSEGSIFGFDLPFSEGK